MNTKRRRGDGIGLRRRRDENQFVERGPDVLVIGEFLLHVVTCRYGAGNDKDADSK